MVSMPAARAGADDDRDVADVEVPEVDAREEAAGKVTLSGPLLHAATARTVTTVRQAHRLMPHFYRTESWWVGQV
jgi:hypothetical protein